ncbi:MAG: ATP-binding cassette domain-containing protein [Anaerovoracaceae bacterium]
MLVKMEKIAKSFNKQIIFDDFNLEIEQGKMYGILGESGSGKSTLLNMMGMLEKPTKGKIYYNGEALPKFNSNKGRKLLENEISFIFQNFALMNNKTVRENLKIIKKSKSKQGDAYYEQLLKKVKLEADEILDKKVYQLSGGEQQRLAIARCLLKKSKLVLADEPTGSLDKINRGIVISILKNLVQEGVTVVIVTHDEEIRSSCDECINI